MSYLGNYSRSDLPNKPMNGPPPAYGPPQGPH